MDIWKDSFQCQIMYHIIYRFYDKKKSSVTRWSPSEYQQEEGVGLRKTHQITQQKLQPNRKEKEQMRQTYYEQEVEEQEQRQVQIKRLPLGRRLLLLKHQIMIQIS